ncbi:hypothetical protein AYI68_g5414 [Smittium mucronatum]|uniref:Uncharacterized protein n=1 Tax=Smittium mucronatum TaxID=133383 RepID=A0A1R0GUD3_9FUNG|nr:hypothetical protein AYI68_g5414 [Smittium mucronatum]
MGTDSATASSVSADTSVVIKSSWNDTEKPQILLDDSSYDSFLLQYPNGIYTTARTVDYTSILALENHFIRIAKSLDLYIKDDQKRKSKFDSEIIRLLGEDSLSEYKEPGFWKAIFLPWIKMGLEKNREIHSEVSIDSNVSSNDASKLRKLQEANVSFAVSIDPLIIRLRISKLKFKGTDNQMVILRKGVRHNPASKQVSWVQERKELEKLLSSTVNEVVLYDPESFMCTEGLSSNFFVVERLSTHESIQSCESSSANPSDVTGMLSNKLGGSNLRKPSPQNDEDLKTLIKNYQIVTSPPSDVLMGTIMQMVIKVCEEDNITVSYKSPSISSLQTGQWVGAFITSTSRLVLPIEIFKLGDRSSFLNIGSSPLVKHIQKRIANLVKEDSVKVL